MGEDGEGYQHVHKGQSKKGKMGRREGVMIIPAARDRINEFINELFPTLGNPTIPTTMMDLLSPFRTSKKRERARARERVREYANK